MSHLNNTQTAEKKKHIKDQQSIILNDKKSHGNMEEPRTKQKNTNAARHGEAQPKSSRSE